MQMQTFILDAINHDKSFNSPKENTIDGFNKSDVAQTSGRPPQRMFNCRFSFI